MAEGAHAEGVNTVSGQRWWLFKKLVFNAALMDSSPDAVRPSTAPGCLPDPTNTVKLKGGVVRLGRACGVDHGREADGVHLHTRRLR